MIDVHLATAYWGEKVRRTPLFGTGVVGTRHFGTCADFCYTSNRLFSHRSQPVYDFGPKDTIGWVGRWDQAKNEQYLGAGCAPGFSYPIRYHIILCIGYFLILPLKTFVNNGQPLALPVIISEEKWNKKKFNHLLTNKRNKHIFC